MAIRFFLDSVLPSSFRRQPESRASSAVFWIAAFAAMTSAPIYLRRQLLAFAIVAGSAVAVSGCDNTTAPDPAVTSVTVAPDNGDLPIGGSVTLIATVRAEGGASQEVQWTSSNDNVATVSATGVVTGHLLGPVDVTATSTFDSEKKDVAALVVIQPDNEPATVTVQGVNRSGTQIPVDPQAVSGFVDVLLNVDPGERLVTRIDILVDGVVAASDVLASPASGAFAALEPAGAPFTATVTFNTGAFNGQTGAPFFMNTAHTVTVRLTTLGGVPGGTADFPLTFANQNTIMALVSTGNPFVADDGGRPWTSGDLTVTAIPVNYTSTVITLSSAVIAFPGLQNKNAGPSGVVTWPRNVAVGSGGSQGFSNNGGLEPLAPVVVQSVLSSGTGPSGQVANAASVAVRLDNRMPNPGTLTLTNQSASTACCSGGWIGNAYLFANGHILAAEDGEGVDGSGVAATGITYHVGSPALSNEQIASSAALTGGTTLAESQFSNAYTVVARVSDRVGNVALTRLAPSTSSPTTTFGVDKRAPTFAFNDPAGLPDGSVNPNGLLFATAPIDVGPAGFAPTPVMHRIFGNFNTPTCFLGGANCTPVLGGTVIAANVEGDFYYTYEAFVRDQAGNASPTIARTVLVDHQLPDITAMGMPGSLVGGATTQFSATVVDNIDVRSAQHRLDFTTLNGPLASLPFQVPVPVSSFGAPQVTQSSVFQDISFVRSIEFTNGSNAPSGTVAPAVGTRFRVVDHGGNVKNLAASFPVGAVPAGTSKLGVGGFQTFRISSPTVPTAVCSRSPCGAVPQSIPIIAEAAGPGGTFNPPFARMFFYWVDADGVTQLMGSSGVPAGADVDGTRRWTWTVNFSPSGAPAQANVQIFAVGVDGEGDGLRSAVISSVSIVVPGL